MQKINKNWAKKSEVTAFDRYEDVYETFEFKKKSSTDKKENKYFFTSENGVTLQISALKAKAKASITRCTFVHPLQQFDDFSYAVEKDKKQAIASDAIEKIVAQNGDLIFSDFLKIVDYQAISTFLRGTIDVKINIPLGENDAILGLGDKTGNLNLRGLYYSNWCTDAFAADKKSNELYRTIPFFCVQTETGCYGIFFDNTFKSFFDFGKAKPDTLSFGADGGIMDFYVIQATDLLQVVQNYTMLTGTPELPPIWALGYHQCRWSYYPESRVREVANDFRRLNIPCDSLYLDIDYMDGYRCFTVNETYFPNLKKLIADLKKDDFETVVMIDCGIFIDEKYPTFTDGRQENIFVKRGNGELAIGPVWPTRCVFPDYTNPRVRQWWAKQYEEFCKDLKVSGFWNDMNEPAVFNVKSMSFLDDLQHDYDGHPTNHAKAHNIYGMQMSRASLDGLKKHQPKKRPFLLCRATFSGGQRYASIWTGDNVSDWEGLRLANLQVQRLSMSGFSFTGPDIGGFAGRPDGELMVRWLQLAIFHPLMRVHSMGNHADGAAMVDEELVKAADAVDRMDQEPWSFGEPFTAAARKAIELRYRLLPYLYNAFFEYVQQQMPIVQSRFLREKNRLSEERDFYFGESIFVSPIMKTGAKSQKIDFPTGDWFDFYTEKKYNGSVTYKVNADEIPFFVKAGTLLPIAPVRQSTKEKIAQMELHFYVGEADIYEQLWYEDDGEQVNPNESHYLKRHFEIEKKEQKVSITQTTAGFYTPDYATYRLKIVGLKAKNIKIEVEYQGEWVILPYVADGVEISERFGKLTMSW